MRARLLPGVVAALALFAGLGVVPGRLAAAGSLVRITTTLEPAAITIAPGDTVTWRNDDQQRHRIRTTGGPGQFDSGDLDPGQSFAVTLAAVGTYAYQDDRNKGLAAYAGTVTVAVGAPQPTGGPTPAPTPAPTPTGPAVIGMAGRAFGPSQVTILVGGQVTWQNNDKESHTATAAGAFDSGVMAPGATFSRTFPTAGAFPFLCLIHPSMTGTVTVLGAPGATAPPPAPTPTPAPTPPPQPGDVLLLDFAFSPLGLTVDAGSRVTFANRGQAAHTVTARDGSFGSPLISPGGVWQQTFATPGTYNFLCTLHPEMTGVISVRGPGGATPPPAAVPTPLPSRPTDVVRVLDFDFQPGTLTVEAGSTVRFTNVGVAPHTVTATGGGFNSGIMNAGADWSWTFAAPGSFDYLCAVHPQMLGRVVVTPSSSGAALPGTTSPAPGGPSPAAVGSPSPAVGQAAGGPGSGTAEAAALAAGGRGLLSGVIGLLLVLGALAAGLRTLQGAAHRPGTT